MTTCSIEIWRRAAKPGLGKGGGKKCRIIEPMPFLISWKISKLRRLP